jgi:hypothetical protein
MYHGGTGNLIGVCLSPGALQYLTLESQHIIHHTSYTDTATGGRARRRNVRRESKQKKVQKPKPGRAPSPGATLYTLSALIVLPITIASHSPAAVESPELMVIGAICGDHARFVTSACAAYAITGSVSTRFLPSAGRGELRRALVLRGEDAGGSECAAASQRRTWQSSAGAGLSKARAKQGERIGVRTGCREHRLLGAAPRNGVDGPAVRLELHDGRTGAAHVKDLDLAAVHMERRHVVGVARVERDAQQRRRRRARALAGYNHRGVLRRRGLVQDR